MHQQGAFVEETAAVKPLERSGAKGELRDLEIKPVLGEVDVATAARWPPLGNGVEGVVGDGEAGVEPKRAADGGVFSVGLDELEVLVETREGLVVSVAVADLVAQGRAQPG